ncbi:plasmid replication protein, CyRepA1 family [Pseudanabaena sp. FACHB-2040]|uniref:plasmid replication protein, CyRepA1 family n=1 Tax=Pseudanabaena sp. FACHB-2040 TaxID=2692859 RepID=UPI001683BD18|nr:plasmid replication protein, CyRepA1 family [Pseudanabaena sp. FACHB-2040]MBD2261118.1 DUF3854 domain-containing protein [Pseudanabaena sp. FACHB-2040]
MKLISSPNRKCFRDEFVGTKSSSIPKAFKTQSEPSWLLQDFRKSAVPDSLTEANVSWIDGDAAVQALAEHKIATVQKVTEYITRPAARILEHYRFAAAGGWIAYGCTLDGESAEVPYFKPIEPRQEPRDGKLRVIKYETPARLPALPLLPFVDEETAQTIYARYGVRPQEGEGFWDVVWRCDLPVAITEGLKKALALMAHGVPAVALRGITQWHLKGSDELHQVVAHFASQGRALYIVFDADERPQVIHDIRRQVLRLGSVLEQHGCKVFAPMWDYEQGKGVDDVLYAKGNEAQSWFDELIRDCPTLNDYKRQGQVAAAIATIRRHNSLSFPIERETEGEYMPALPELQQGAIHVLDAPVNSGKTTRIGKDWVKAAISRGWRVLVLSPLNSLGQQTAKDWGLPHIHHFGTKPEEQQALWASVSHDGGVVMCPDSLHRIPDWFWSKPVLLVLDEANQVVEHTAQGDTLGQRYADILERLSAAAQHAIATGAIVLSEAGIPDRAVKFVQALSGAQQVRVFRHRKQGIPWECTLFSGQASGFRAQVLASIARGELILFVTSSQREGRRLQAAISKEHAHKKVVRVDSETNEQGAFNSFFEAPDEWLQVHRPDVLILSPSAKSGVSIQGGILTEDAYFSQVWAYFPTLGTDTHLQMLGRFRPSVPRFIFCPPFILAGGDEGLANPRAVKRRLMANLEGISGVFGLQELTQGGERSEHLLTIESAVLDYLAAAKTVTGAQKSIAQQALAARLEADGHTVRTVQVLKDQRACDLWKAIDEQLWRSDAEEIAALQPSDQQDVEWAFKALGGNDTSYDVRMMAHKVLWRDEFPGVTFDDPEDVYQALTKDFGAMRRGVLMQARAENLNAAKEQDRQAATNVLSASIRAPHRLPKNFIKATLIAKTGVLALLDGSSWSNVDARAIAVKKAALYWAKEIYYWLKLQVKPEQTPCEIANKLIRKLGLKAVATARPGKRSQSRNRLWSIEDAQNPTRVKLLEALRRKFSGSVSTICNKDSEIPDQIMDTTQTEPPNERLVESAGQVNKVAQPRAMLCPLRKAWEASGSSLPELARTVQVAPVM